MTNKKDKPKRYRNLKPAWKPGQAGNPQGRPPRDVQQRELISQLADHGDEALATVIAVMRKARASAGDAVKLRAAQDVLDKLSGRAPQSLAASIVQRSIAHDGTLIEGSAIGAMSPLLQAAHAHFAEEEVRQLAAPQAVSEPSSAPPQAESVVITPPPSVQIPEPPVMETKPPEPAPEAPKAPAGIPAESADFMNRLAKEREERRKRLPGGQLSAQEHFPADPVETSVQGPLEVVNFTRIPGGRGIRRV